jgi:hypothetical protein
VPPSQIPACGITAPGSSVNAQAGQRRSLACLVVNLSCRVCGPVQSGIWYGFHHLRRRQLPARQTASELRPRHRATLAAAVEPLVEQPRDLEPLLVVSIANSFLRSTASRSPSFRQRTFRIHSFIALRLLRNFPRLVRRFVLNVVQIDVGEEQWERAIQWYLNWLRPVWRRGRNTGAWRSG